MRFMREKSIDKEIVIQAMEHALQKAARSRYGAEHDIRATIDPKTGDQHWHLDDYIKRGGYVALKKIIAEKITPDAIIDELGDYHDALDIAADMAGMPKPPKTVREEPRKRAGLIDFLGKSFVEWMVGQTREWEYTEPLLQYR